MGLAVPSGIGVNADDAVWEECLSPGCRCPDVGSAVVARRESATFRSVLTWPAARGVWAVGRCLTSMRLRGGGGRQSYAAKRCSPLLEGPPATRGSTFPLRAAPNHSIRQRSARHNPTRGWRADLEAQVPAYLRTCLPHTNTSGRLT